MKDAPVVTLKNGIRIANFSSPHPFTFDDGTVLPACDEERCRTLSLTSQEIQQPRTTDGKRWMDIELRFELSGDVVEEIVRLNDSDDVDIVIVPFPVMETWKRSKAHWGKIRVCRLADRVTKTVCSDKFCI